MLRSFNLHKLFDCNTGYLHALRVRDADITKLSNARNRIRQRLQEAFGGTTDQFELATERAIAPEESGGGCVQFRILGSFAYGLANDCQQPPMQQIDQDDGVFLPLSFGHIDGSAQPVMSVATYFNVVERAIAPLCHDNQWTLNPRGERNYCVRIGLDRRLHIDLPLYAVQDRAFSALLASYRSMDKDQTDRKTPFQMRIDLPDHIYERLTDAEMRLAHRTRGWIASDPRGNERWLAAAVLRHGVVICHLTRIFKGIRDAKLDVKLSSIDIMALVISAVERLDLLDATRLDLSLIAVARQIARQVTHVSESPKTPWSPENPICEAWSIDRRQGVAKLFVGVADALEKAADGTNSKDFALGQIRHAVGGRVPADENLILLTCLP